MAAKTTGEQPKRAPDRWTFGVEEGGGVSVARHGPDQ